MSTGTQAPMTDEELSNLSDEELMNMVAPPVMAAQNEEAAEEAATLNPENSGDVAGTEDGDLGAGEENTEDQGEDPNEEAGETAANDEQQGDAELSDEDASRPGSQQTADDGNKADPAPSEEGKQEAEEPDGGPDYKDLYSKVMAPFKANGKEITPKSPEDAIQLMQMGANYTKKMQALQPHLKVVRMLEDQGLLEEGKLEFLIDVNKKNPAAIQKLLKDSNIDPLDIDVREESDYKPGNYRVSDAEMNFETVLKDVASTQNGKEMIKVMNEEWDGESKKALWNDPTIMTIMADQKAQGIYDKIASEIEYRRTLGKIPEGTPFLTSYETVGRELNEAGMLNAGAAAGMDQGAKDPRPQAPSRTVVETRPQRRKPVSNNERARAASPTNSSPNKVKQEFNPLALSDEEFEKQAQLANRY